MLQQVRSALKGVIAWFVIVLLILAFALWGVPELTNFAAKAPLTVGGETFSRQQILNEFNRQMTMRRNQESGYSREQALADGLPDRVISTLASRSVMEQEALKMGLVMPRSVVRDFLRNEEGFRNPLTGEVDRFALESIARNNSMTIGQLEAVLKSDLLREQLMQSLRAGAPAPRAFVEPLLLRDVERRDVAYLVITDELAGIAAEPTPDALRAYYQDNPAPFTAPEYRIFTYVALEEKSFRAGLSASEEDLQRLYEVNRVRLYDKPETRTLYQITFEGEAQAQAAAGALREGTPFEAVASERGLNLAAVTFTEITQKDILDPGVAKAAFAEDLEPGSVTDPIRSLLGWTVVQLVAVNEAQTRTFEEVRDELEAQLFEQDSRRQLFEAVEEIENARDGGAGLAAAAEHAGHAVQRIGPVDAMSFTPGGAILSGVPGEVLRAAFRLDEGDESEALDLGEGRGYFFIHVEEVRPPALHPYEDVVEDVQRRWRADERDQRIAATALALREQIEAGASFEEAAAAFNRTPLLAPLTRQASSETFARPFVREIFLADKGAVVTGPTAFGAAQVVAQVRDIAYARERIGPGEEVGYAQYIGFVLDQELLDAYVTTLRDSYGVRAEANVVAQLFSELQ